MAKKRFTESEMLGTLRHVCELSTAKKVANDLGFTPQFICDVLAERRRFSEKLASALGYQREISYVRKSE